jgi:hypothetical protein
VISARLLVLVFVALLAGCASTRVVVEELPADRWRVSYSLPSPRSSLVFAREGPFRAEKWTIVEPKGARWDGSSSIAFAAPASHVVLELATDLTARPKDYAVHVAFTDGSRLLYTGHLRVDRARFAFRSPRHVLVPSKHDDTYVYFGSIPPLKTRRMTLVVDPGLPAWIGRQLNERVPPMFDSFAAKMQTELGFVPLVFVSYGGAAGSGRSFKGGTLPGIIQLAVEGAGWPDESKDAAQMWYSRVAHEVFHLWESQRFTEGEDPGWLGEASAEYASLVAMRNAGVIDKNAMDRLLVEAANECIANLGDTALVNAIEKGHFRNVYTCGLVSQWLAAAQAGDLWPIYRRTFDRGRPWRTADFLESVRGMKDVEQLVTGRTERADLFLLDALRKSGIAVKLVPPSEGMTTQAVWRSLVAARVRQCAGRELLADTVNDISVRFHPEKALAALERGGTIRVNDATLQCAGEADPHFAALLQLDR